MREYCILEINNGGTPFIAFTFNTLESAIRKIYYLIDCRSKYTYYVDNDFFENVYSQNFKIDFYYQIQVREVTPYKKYTEETEIENLRNNKIIYLKNF